MNITQVFFVITDVRFLFFYATYDFMVTVFFMQLLSTAFSHSMVLNKQIKNYEFTVLQFTNL